MQILYCQPEACDSIDKKLVINPTEAETVRAIFVKFAEVKSVPAALLWCYQQGLTTKQRQRQGRAVGGARFHYGALRCVLGNRTYVGEIAHKGTIYQGQHEPIVERELFEQAQTILGSLSTEAMRQPRLVSASLLQGLIVDRHGRTMGPAHTTRSGQRFRYYVTHPKTITDGGPAPYRLAAEELERNCANLIAEHLAGMVSSVDGEGDAKRLAAILLGAPHDERRALMVDRVRKIIIGDAELTIELADGHSLRRFVERVRHGNDAKLLIGPPDASEKPKADPQLIILLRDAHRAKALALAKPKLTVDQLAAKFGRSTERYKRLLRLSYLSPTIIDAIIASRQPPHLTNRFLQNLDGLPWSWAEQHKLLLG